MRDRAARRQALQAGTCIRQHWAISCFCSGAHGSCRPSGLCCAARRARSGLVLHLRRALRCRCPTRPSCRGSVQGSHGHRPQGAEAQHRGGGRTRAQRPCQRPPRRLSQPGRPEAEARRVPGHGQAPLATSLCVATPDVTSFEIGPQQAFVLLGCDGLWSAFSGAQAVIGWESAFRRSTGGAPSSARCSTMPTLAPGSSRSGSCSSGPRGRCKRGGRLESNGDRGGPRKARQGQRDGAARAP